MYGRSAIWFPLALLALLAALTFWIDRTVQPPQPKRDGSSRHDMDYKLNNFSTTRMDRDGSPRYVLSATELVHYPDDDSTQLVRPRFTQYAARKPYTQIQGQRGNVSSNGENVYFMDNVRVVRGAESGRGEMTVLTEYLHLIPDQDIAETDRPVSILQAPRTVIRATGLVYNKKLRILKLSGRAHVHYERPGAALQPRSAPLPLKPVASARQAKPSGTKSAGATKKMPARTARPAMNKPQTSPQTKNVRTTTRIRRHYDNTTR